MKKALYISIGVIATALAVLGAVLPGLPSTVFVLVALWAFAESSPRLHKWLHQIPILRTPLRHAKLYQEKRTIEIGIKWLAGCASWLSAIIFILVNGSKYWPVSALLVLFSMITTAFMVLTPTAEPRKSIKNE